LLLVRSVSTLLYQPQSLLKKLRVIIIV